MSDAALGRRALALVLAALTWFALALQLVLTLKRTVAHGATVADGLMIYFGYFTILTNLLVGASLALPLAAPASHAGRWFSRPSVMLGIATSIAFVGLSYHFLLRHVWHPQGAQLLADLSLHYAVPLLYVLYWWIESPRGTAPRWSDPVWWSLYPCLYLAYALIRGALIASYPYPFIDAAAIGYQRTLLNGIGLLLVFNALGFLLVAVDRLRRRARTR